MGENLRSESTNYVCSEWCRAEEKHRRALQSLGEARARMAECQGVLTYRLNRAFAGAVVAPDGTVFLAQTDDSPTTVLYADGDLMAIKPLNPWQLDELLAPQPAGQPDDDGNEADDTAKLVNGAVKAWEMAS